MLEFTFSKMPQRLFSKILSLIDYHRLRDIETEIKILWNFGDVTYSCFLDCRIFHWIFLQWYVSSMVQCRFKNWFVSPCLRKFSDNFQNLGIYFSLLLFIAKSRTSRYNYLLKHPLSSDHFFQLQFYNLQCLNSHFQKYYCRLKSQQEHPSFRVQLWI